MRPVMQTRDGWPRGNCLESATASILECDVADLPNLYDEGERRGGHEKFWWGVYLEAMKDRGFAVACIPNGVEGYPEYAPRGYAIASLTSDYRAMGHAVVALDGRIVHDPHPNKPSTDMSVYAWYVLVPLASSPRGAKTPETPQ